MVAKGHVSQASGSAGGEKQDNPVKDEAGQSRGRPSTFQRIRASQQVAQMIKSYCLGATAGYLRSSGRLETKKDKIFLQLMRQMGRWTALVV